MVSNHVQPTAPDEILSRFIAIYEVLAPTAPVSFCDESPYGTLYFPGRRSSVPEPTDEGGREYETSEPVSAVILS